MSTITKNQDAHLELPKVDWLDKEVNPQKFFKDLSYALSEFGFMVLTNAPGSVSYTHLTLPTTPYV